MIAAMWHPAKNDEIQSIWFAPYSTQKAWWIDWNGREVYRKRWINGGDVKKEGLFRVIMMKCECAYDMIFLKRANFMIKETTG